MERASHFRWKHKHNYKTLIVMKGYKSMTFICICIGIEVLVFQQNHQGSNPWAVVSLAFVRIV